VHEGYRTEWLSSEILLDSNANRKDSNEFQSRNENLDCFYRFAAFTFMLLKIRKRKKKHVGGKKEKKNKDRAFARPSLELSPFMLSQLSNTVYQRIELT